MHDCDWTEVTHLGSWFRRYLSDNCESRKWKSRRGTTEFVIRDCEGNDTPDLVEAWLFVREQQMIEGSEDLD